MGKFREDLVVHGRAGYSGIVVNTTEVSRVKAECFQAAKELKRGYREWRSTSGWLEAKETPEGITITDDQGGAGSVADPIESIGQIGTGPNGCIYVFWAFNELFRDPLARQMFLDVLAPAREQRKLIVLVGSFTLPTDLASEFASIDFDLPNRQEIELIARNLIDQVSGQAQTEPVADDEVSKIVDAALGLSELEAQNAFALSLVRNKKLDRSSINETKKEIVKRSGIIEYIDTDVTFDQIGGLEPLKDWLRTRSKGFSQEARDFKLPPPKGILLAGLAGCLDRDTLIPIRKPDGSTGKWITIEELYYRFNGKHIEGVNKGRIQKNKKVWKVGRQVLTQSLDESTGRVRTNLIKDIYFSGVKEVCRINTNEGYSITATQDHRFYTPSDGYLPLSALKVNDEVAVYIPIKAGVPCASRLLIDNARGRNTRQQIQQINGVGNHPYARRRFINKLEYSSHPMHRLVVEAHMNNLRLEDYLHYLQGDITDLKFLDPGLEVHHIDRDRRNNSFSNLKVLTKEGHAALHMAEEPWRAYTSKARIHTIKSIEKIGKRRTYDIEMQNPFNNFVANGFIVHNSGKSYIARGIAKEWGLPLLILDVGKAMGSLVGESEKNIREALSTAMAVAPAVMIVDEMEKAFAGLGGSSSDGGTTQRVAATVLNWMQERPQDKPIFLIGTCNQALSMPPEMLRKGRWDELWFVGLPTAKERAAIFKVHLNKLGRGSLEWDYDLLSSMAEGFTGAEIEEACKAGLWTAFAAGRELTIGDLNSSIRETIPLSKGPLKPVIDEMINDIRFRKANAEPATQQGAGTRVVEA